MTLADAVARATRVVAWSRTVTLIIAVTVCCTVVYVVDRVLEVLPCATP